MCSIDIVRCLHGIAPVDYVHAALILEYVDVSAALATISGLLASHGVLDVAIQMPGEASAPVTATPCSSMQSLAPVMRLIPQGELREAAAAVGLLERSSRTIPLQHGKRFLVNRYSRTS